MGRRRRYLGALAGLAAAAAALTPAPAGAAAPAAPVFAEPERDGLVLNPTDVHMAIRGYSDPDGDPHVCSDWEIWRVSRPARVWSAPCAGSILKVHIHLPDGVFQGPARGRSALEFGTAYRLRMRVHDASGEVGPWVVRAFRTAAAGPSGRPSPVPWAVRQPGYRVDVVATGFQLPVNIAFVPRPGRGAKDALFYVAELYGTIKVVLRDYSVRTYARGLVNFGPTLDQQGLTGIAVDPESGDLFASITYQDVGSNETLKPAYARIVRLESGDRGRKARSTKSVLEIRERFGAHHLLSTLTIGPDGKLYAHVGDGEDEKTAQYLDDFRGSIIRLELDGSPVPTNPFYDASNGISPTDYTYAWGFRNPFGGAWRMADGFLYQVENGPREDRFAKVIPGENYGWPFFHDAMKRFALYRWVPSHAPVNLAFVQPGTFGGSGFPPGKQGHAFVTEAGPGYGTGPQEDGKRISEFVLGRNGRVVRGPVPLVEYSGVGKATTIGLAAGPDGLYFTDFYKDVDAKSLSDPGANVLRVSYAPRRGSSCTITGTAGDDHLAGTPGDDVLCGLAGDDVLHGLAGNDRLLGGPGVDRGIGGPGRDRCETERRSSCP